MRQQILDRLTNAIRDLADYTSKIGTVPTQLALAINEITAVRIEIESRKGKYPTLDEVKLLAAKAGLPDVEAEKFYYHFESNGWRVGKNPMKSVGGAIGTWKHTWRERTHQGPVNGHTPCPVKVRERFQIERDIAGIQRRIAEIRSGHGQYLEQGTWQGPKLPDAERMKVKALVETKKKLQEQYDSAPA